MLSSVHDSVYLLVPVEWAAEIGAECKAAALELWAEYFDPKQNLGWSKIWVPGDVDIEIYSNDGAN